MPIILFDIDGTLIRSGGAGKAAMEAALLAAFGIAEVKDVVPYSGRTDTAIARDLLGVHDIDPSLDNQRALREAYLAQLPGCLKSHGGKILPGVGELLVALQARSDVVLGLLTGNIRVGAKTKLGHFGLWEYFTCGGFGDEHFDRDDVAREALAAVTEHLGKSPNLDRVWVIGDTPLDVRCARAIGAKVVAVATGAHSVADLMTSRPDVAVETLTDTAALLALWR